MIGAIITTLQSDYGPLISSAIMFHRDVTLKMEFIAQLHRRDSSHEPYQVITMVE